MKKKLLNHVDSCINVAGKVMIIVLIVILIAQFFVIAYYSFSPFYANAQEVETSWIGSLFYGERKPELGVPVGDKIEFATGKPETWLGQYIQAWYHYVVGAIGIIAVVMVMWGGIKWITAGGNPSQIDAAKGNIKNAIIGIVLLLLSYTIFRTVNPALLNLRLPDIQPVTDIYKDYTETCAQKEYDIQCNEPFQIKNKKGETMNCIGKKCDNNQTCTNIGEKNVLGGELFACRLLPCKNNDDSMCGAPNLICNMNNGTECAWNNITGTCCQEPAKEGESCAETSDCQTNLECTCTGIILKECICTKK